ARRVRADWPIVNPPSTRTGRRYTLRYCVYGPRFGTTAPATSTSLGRARRAVKAVARAKPGDFRWTRNCTSEDQIHHHGFVFGLTAEPPGKFPNSRPGPCCRDRSLMKWD